ncbi:MAG: dTDP-4-dehydrorhamnose 3,5-epimerase [Thermoanaerobaculia bacterium]
MKVLDTPLPEVKLVEPDTFGDDRGFFQETWNQARYTDLGIAASFRQSNLSVSRRGVLRGLHFQQPRPQGKLVYVLSGVVFDVAVDIRVGSPRFGRWWGTELSGDNHRQLWVPEGFAHGFCVLSERAVFAYLCTTEYDRQADRALRFDDAEIGVEWPARDPELSAKDAAAPLLAELRERDLLPRYEP